MKPALPRLALGLLAGLVFANTAMAASKDPTVVPAAAPDRKPILASDPSLDPPLQWDRLEPAAVDRATPGRAPKAPAFPAERR